MECPKCHSEDLYIADGPDFALESSEETLIIWRCCNCGTRFAVRYDMKPREIEILE